MTRSGRNTIHPKRLELPLHSSPGAQVQISSHTAQRGDGTGRRSAAMRHKGHLPFQSRKQDKTVYNNQEIEFKAKSTEDRLYDAVTLNKKRLTNLPKPAPIRADM